MARVAILIDGDNISATHGQRVAALGMEHGRVDVHRVYLNAINSSGWNSVPGVTLMHAGSGKNAADLLLSIDAMEFALTGWFDTFVLASSDRDFSHLAMRLRQHGSAVVGAGPAQAANRLKASCTRFVELTAPVSDFDKKIRTIVTRHAADGVTLRVTELGARMHHAYGVQIRNHAPGKWRGYLASHPDLYGLDKRGPDALVRIKSNGFGG